MNSTDTTTHESDAVLTECRASTETDERVKARKRRDGVYQPKGTKQVAEVLGVRYQGPKDSREAATKYRELPMLQRFIRRNRGRKVAPDVGLREGGGDTGNKSKWRDSLTQAHEQLSRD